VHLIGACGAGMRALAELLRDAGCRVTGSDAATDSRTAAALHAVGVELHAGHAAEHIPLDCDRVIHSAAIPANNPERLAAQTRGLTLQSYPQFLGELSRSREAVCIAGTHGKSTTTALLASLLGGTSAPTTVGQVSYLPLRAEGEAGRKPAPRECDVICGAELVDRGRAGWRGDGERLVVESCEFRRHFLQLTPHTLVVTGIEWDHVDCFGSLSDTVDAFSSLMRRVREDGLLVYRSDCRATRRAMVDARMDRRCTGPRVVSCGIAPDADWRIVSRIVRPGGCVVELNGPADELVRLAVPLIGAHNAQNAVVAAVAALESGVPADDVTAAVAAFRGVRRRLQHLGEWRGMTLFDDYAHHPTAVRAVIAALREEFPNRRLLVAFEPHQVQRTETFCEGFAEALAGADRSWVLPAYAARESAAVDSVQAAQRVVERIAARGGRSHQLPSLDRLPVALETEGRPGDVVVLMGAGSMERMADEFSVRLRRHHAG
jgi:UDP-N-acetylmuramate--alanine ligase